MDSWQLTRMGVENYKSIEEGEIEISGVSVLIGKITQGNQIF
jgi:predicted ATPase